MTSFLPTIKLFKELLITDLILMKEKLSNTLINTLTVITTVTLATTYIFPLMGLGGGYASMFLIGFIVSCGIFESFGNTATMVADIEGDRTISYLLTLPLPGWLVLTQKALSYAIHNAILTLFILPIGKIVMGERLLLSAIQPGKFLLAFIFIHLFCGFYSLVMTAYTANMQSLFNIWNRALFPLWFFGGSQFNWYTLKKLSPWLAYLNLLNPLVYAFEAIKSASLPNENFLPFWACIIALTFFSTLFLYIAHKKLQKRLDYL